MNLFSQELSKIDFLKRVGDISQIAGAKMYELKGGKANGVRAVDIKTGRFRFTVLLDRGMDIAWADYMGIPFSYISKVGICSPAFFEKDGLGFLRSFAGGLLTTCGLTYMGAPCNDMGEELGLHGRVSNIPADDVSVYAEWEGEEYLIKVRGKMRESRMFGENITLTREITTKLGSKSFSINDTVENLGFNEQPLMILYHFNFGYPIVDKNTILIQPETSVTPRDDESKKRIGRYNRFDAPKHNFKEQVFYHDMKPDTKGFVGACLFNEMMGEKGLGVYIRYKKHQLKHMVEWKQTGEGDYVVGLEPGTWYPEGRKKARELGQLDRLLPGEARNFQIEVGATEEKDLF